MAAPLQSPLPGVVVKYEGIYRPHWEIPHIEIRVARSRMIVCLITLAIGVSVVSFGLGSLDLFTVSWFSGVALVFVVFPAKERWNPIFLCDCHHGLDEEGGRIEFEGIVSSRGHFGHMGVMRREVKIVCVLRYKNATPAGQLDPQPLAAQSAGVLIGSPSSIADK